MKVQGCVATFSDPEGRVIASVNDFEKQGYGGFSLKEAQRIRCKDKIGFEVIKSYSSSALWKNISNYTANKIYDDLLSKGFKIHFEYIGYEETEKNE